MFTIAATVAAAEGGPGCLSALGAASAQEARRCWLIPAPVLPPPPHLLLAAAGAQAVSAAARRHAAGRGGGGQGCQREVQAAGGGGQHNRWADQQHCGRALCGLPLEGRQVGGWDGGPPSPLLWWQIVTLTTGSSLTSRPARVLPLTSNSLLCASLCPCQQVGHEPLHRLEDRRDQLGRRD